jgi:hypothetical protein
MNQLLRLSLSNVTDTFVEHIANHDRHAHDTIIDRSRYTLKKLVGAALLGLKCGTHKKFEASIK